MKKAKVVLIIPQIVCGKDQIRRAQPSIGIGHLAAVLVEAGHEVMIIDAAVEDYNHLEIVVGYNDLIKYGLSNDKIVEKLKTFNADVVGISSLFSSQGSAALALAEEVKKNYPRLPIIFGGIHASQQAEQILNYSDCVDYILAGEADFTFTELVEKLISSKTPLDVPGLIWRSNGKVIHNKVAPFIFDMDQLPLPAWHLMKMEKYFEIAMPHNPFVKSGRVGCIMTSRGCPQKCFFCSSSDFFGHRFRAMSAKYVIKMVEHLVSEYNIKELQILDDTFTTDFKRVIEICHGIEKFKLRITLPNAVRADLPRNHKYRLEMFKSLKSAGCDQLGIAVEHGDQKFLDNVICKKLDLDEAVVTCELAHKAGLLVHCNFMVGFPYETCKERRKTADFAKKVGADSFSVSLATPLPGTKMWDIVEKNNLFAEDFDINQILYGKVSIIPEDISCEDLLHFVKELNKELNILGAKKNPASLKKYQLLKGKSSHGDRKYQFSEKTKNT